MDAGRGGMPGQVHSQRFLEFVEVDVAEVVGGGLGRAGDGHVDGYGDR